MSHRSSILNAALNAVTGLAIVVFAAFVAFAHAPVAAGEVGGEAADDGGLGGMGGLLGEGIDFRGGMLDWEEDAEGHRVAILRNYAVVILPQVTISARNMVLNIELQEIYAEGDVLFDEETGNAFYCDQLTFNYQEWQGLAKNIRVKMDREGVDLPVRDFLDARPSLGMRSTQSINDSTTNTGELKRMYAQAEELRVHDSETFELIDAKITPSSFARPHWFFRSPAALYRRKEKIESYHNTVNIGRVPVLYIPYLIRDLQYDWPWMRVEGGSTSDWGVYIKSQWGWRMAPQPDAYFRMDKIIFDVDWYNRRGAGFGAETTYNMGDLDSLGKLKIYGVYEYGISDAHDASRAFLDNIDKIYSVYPDGSRNPGFRPSYYQNDFRWAVDWEHYQQLNDFWDVRAEAHLYHDRDYLREYDETRYWEDKEPENSIDVRRLDRQWELEFVASSRLSNKWQTQSEYYPEMRLSVPGMQIGDLPLYFKNDMRLGVVNRRFDEDAYSYTKDNGDGLFAVDPVTGLSTSRLIDDDNYGTMFRAFNEMRIEAPIKAWELFTIKPWVGLRTAYYTDTTGQAYGSDYWFEQIKDHVSNGQINDPALVQQQHPDAYDYFSGRFTPNQLQSRGTGRSDLAVPFGVEFSTRSYTLFGANEQWRVITEPVFSYTENTSSRLEYPKNVYPIDSYDVYDRQRRFSYELHTKLQRRYFEDAPGATVPERDVLDFNIAVHQYPRKSDRERLNDDNRFSDIIADVTFRPTERLTLTASADWDLNDETLNRAILGADWRLNDMFRAYVTHLYYRGTYQPYYDIDPSSQTQFALRTKLWNDSSRYSIEGAVAYEWRDSSASAPISGSDPDPLPPPWKTGPNAVRHGFNRYRVTLFRDMDTFEFALSYIRDRNDDDHGLFFSFSPKAFMGYDRPPPAYSVDVETLAAGRYPEATRYLDDGYLIDGAVADADLKDVQF